MRICPPLYNTKILESTFPIEVGSLYFVIYTKVLRNELTYPEIYYNGIPNEYLKDFNFFLTPDFTLQSTNYSKMVFYQ